MDIKVFTTRGSSAEVKVAALNALTSALEYIKPNFESEVRYFAHLNRRGHPSQARDST